MSETLIRECAVCGTELEITVDDDGSYTGGHYFGEMDVVDGEYWECDECASGPDDERHGAFDDAEPVSMGGDGLETHDLVGHESDEAFEENKDDHDE